MLYAYTVKSAEICLVSYDGAMSVVFYKVNFFYISQMFSGIKVFCVLYFILYMKGCRRWSY